MERSVDRCLNKRGSTVQDFAANDPWVVIINRLAYIPLIVNIFNPLTHYKGLYAIIDATAPSPVPVTKANTR